MANPNTLSFLRYQDIQIPDVNLKNQFDVAIGQGDYTTALKILTQNDQLTGKAYTAQCINKIIAGISYLESQYADNTTIYMSKLSESFEELLQRFHELTDWSDTEIYDTLRFVRYNDRVYMATQEGVPAGTLPTNEAFWLYLGLEGKAGKFSVDGEFKSNWDSNISYSKNDAVVYKDSVYIAVKDNTNVEPTNKDTWALLWYLIKGKIYVGKTAPTENLIENTIWFETDAEVADMEMNKAHMGTFKRYDEYSSDWQTMFPEILFEGIDQYNDFRLKGKESIMDLRMKENRWTVADENITTNSIIRIYPEASSWTQDTAYNELSKIEIVNGGYTLYASNYLSAPTVISVYIIY